MTYVFIYQREYFNPSRFGAERNKKVRAENIEDACQQMLAHMNQWFNIGCKDYVYDELGNEISISGIECIQHMILPN